MTARLKRIKLRDLALFVVVARVVAVTTVCGAQKVGLDGERAGARTEADSEQQAQSVPSQEAPEESLRLSLSAAQQIRETKRARESYGIRFETVEEGNEIRREVMYGWAVEGSVVVSWSATGGQAPYTLEIGNESAYRSLAYRGATGGTGISCADTSGGTTFDYGERPHALDPQFDSGWKTVRPTVTNTNGDAAEATAEFYPILVGPGMYPALLQRHETYRIYGC